MTLWALSQEEKVLKRGEKLSEKLMEVARDIGVARPEEVRVLEVDQIPLPPFSHLFACITSTNLPHHPNGIAYGHALYIRRACRDDLSLWVHELTHVAQSERCGGTAKFIESYLDECLKNGYYGNRFEKEAYEKDSLFMR